MVMKIDGRFSREQFTRMNPNKLIDDFKWRVQRDVWLELRDVCCFHPRSQSPEIFRLAFYYGRRLEW